MSKSASPHWPLIISFYIACAAIGTSTAVLAHQHIVINAFDFVLAEVIWMILPISAIISLLFFYVGKNGRFFRTLSIPMKVFFHSISIVFISWAFIGSIQFINQRPESASDFILKGKMLELFEKEPTKSGLVRNYHESRYFVRFEESEKQKEFTLQIPKEVFDSLQVSTSIPIHFENGKLIFSDAETTQISLHLKKGCLGFFF